ncbi:response regulator [Acidovorax sp.]|uniref:response regulator n=1 Tax=Acidovorax sp. TaxID=1872122 RepID=UPI00391F766B
MPIRHAYLIEDNPTIRSNLIPTLSEMADVKVIGTAEGENEAVDWLTRFAIQADFIILDLFLAEGSGLGVLRQVAAHHITVPVVVLTNYATQDIRERCKALGAAALFDKSRELESFLAYCAEPSSRGPH